MLTLLYAIYQEYNIYLIRKCVDRYAKCPRETEVTQFEFTFPVDKKVLGLEISMKDSILMTKSCPFQQLVHETPHGNGVQCTAVAMGIHVFLQIPITVFEDKDKLCFGVDNVVQADDVDMLEFLHERDLSDRGGGSPFFSIKVDLFEGDNFVCGPGATLQCVFRCAADQRVEWLSVPCTRWRMYPHLEGFMNSGSQK